MSVVRDARAELDALATICRSPVRVHVIAPGKTYGIEEEGPGPPRESCVFDLDCRRSTIASWQHFSTNPFRT